MRFCVKMHYLQFSKISTFLHVYEDFFHLNLRKNSLQKFHAEIFFLRHFWVTILFSPEDSEILYFHHFTGLNDLFTTLIGKIIFFHQILDRNHFFQQNLHEKSVFSSQISDNNLRVSSVI